MYNTESKNFVGYVGSRGLGFGVNSTGGFNDATVTSTGIGQSFTLPYTMIVQQLRMETYGYDPSVFVTLKIFSGSGFTGSLIATTTSRSTYPQLVFNLPANVILNLGSTYTYQLTAPGRNVVVDMSTANPYADGVFYDSTGSQASNDLTFQISGVSPARWEVLN